MTILEIEEDFRVRLRGRDGFDEIFAIEGEIYRQVARRHTLRFERGGQAYFIKAHRGVGWREIFKNILTLRLPVIGAKNEWLAIRRLSALGIRTPRAVAYGKRGIDPARQQSFLVTEDIGPSVSLEELCATWRANPPSPKAKWQLIADVAAIARTLHENGVNHRDFYLCHFMQPLDNPRALILIDLHRAQLRTKTPERWVIKDVGGLYFSAMDIGLTQRDLFRFIKHYRRCALRESLRNDEGFWREVQQRANRLYSQ